MIIIVAKQLGKLNPIDYSAEVSHALKSRVEPDRIAFSVLDVHYLTLPPKLNSDQILDMAADKIPLRE